MRTDVKVAVGVVLVLIAGMIIYFVAVGRHSSETATTMTPHVSEPLEPAPAAGGNDTGPVVSGPGALPSVTVPRPGAGTEPASTENALAGGPGAAVPPSFNVGPPPMAGSATSPATQNAATDTLAGGGTLAPGGLTSMGNTPAGGNTPTGNTSAFSPGSFSNTSLSSNEPADSNLSNLNNANSTSDLGGSSAEYTVKKGDMLYSIARTHGVSLKALERANPSLNPNRLHIGQKIKIPAATGSTGGTSHAAALSSGSTSSSHASASAGGTYTVKRGDTLASISRTIYGNSGHWQEIARLNHLKSPNVIRVGTVLKLPPK